MIINQARLELASKLAQQFLSEIKFNLIHPDYDKWFKTEIKRYYKLLVEIEKELGGKK